MKLKWMFLLFFRVTSTEMILKRVGVRGRVCAREGECVRGRAQTAEGRETDFTAAFCDFNQNSIKNFEKDCSFGQFKLQFPIFQPMGIVQSVKKMELSIGPSQ